MTNKRVNNFANTVKHQASARQDKAGQQINYLLIQQRWLALNRNRYPILVAHAQTQKTGRLQKSYRPPMAMAERPFSVLKVIVAAQFFLSCYFKVELLHNVTLM